MVTRGRLQIAAAASAVTIMGACTAHGEPPSAASPTSTTIAPTSAAVTSATPVTVCRQRNLIARFAGGGMGTGNDFGSIVIWNTASFPCRVAGPVGFTAVYTGGHADRNARANRPVPPVDVVLEAKMAAFRDGEDPAGYLTADFMGPERDDPNQADGLCRQQDKLAPAILVLRIGKLLFRIPNSDPQSLQVKQVYGCHGRVLLEEIEQAT